MRKPFSDTPPSGAIRRRSPHASAGGGITCRWRPFHDETEALLEEYEARLTLVECNCQRTLSSLAR